MPPILFPMKNARAKCGVCAEDNGDQNKSNYAAADHLPIRTPESDREGEREILLLSCYEMGTISACS